MSSLVTISGRSINHYLVGCRGDHLLIDADFAGTLPQLRHGLKRSGIDLLEIGFVIMTHNHPDHGGLTQEVKRAASARLVIHERQIPYLEELGSFYRRKNQNGGYQPILIEKSNIVVTTASSRKELASIGIDGQIVETPGHSEDSVSLVLDNGDCFVGDLNLPDRVHSAQAEQTNATWRKLLNLGARTAYPSHTDPIPAEAIARRL